MTRRRDISIALFASAGAAALPPSSTQAQSSAAAQCCPPTHDELAAGVVPNTDYPPQNVLRYGADPTGLADSTLSLIRAVSLNDEVLVPAGDYKISGTISKTLTKSFRIQGAGQGVTRLFQHSDADALALSNTSAPGAQITIEGLSLVPATSMSSGAAISIRDDKVLPSVTVRDVFIGGSSGGEFKYGIRTLNCTESRFERVTIYGLNALNLIAWDLRSSIASTVPKFFGCSVYNALTAVNIVNSVKPGIEGTQFYGCDFVAVKTGVFYLNSLPGYTYFPPQITWIGGHINASYRNLDIAQAAQISVLGALLYNSGTDGQFLCLSTCSDLNIQGNQFVQIAGNSDGIQYSSGTLVNGGIIANNHFSMAEKSSAIRLNASHIQNLHVQNNVRLGGATMVSVTGPLENSVRIDNNHPLDTDDVFQLVTLSGPVITLAGLRSNFIVIRAPESNIIITKLLSRRSGETVTLKCDSPNLMLQHNAASPDGFFLKNAANFTFASGSLITLHNGYGGYWTEMSRSA